MLWGRSRVPSITAEDLLRVITLTNERWTEHGNVHRDLSDRLDRDAQQIGDMLKRFEEKLDRLTASVAERVGRDHGFGTIAGWLVPAMLGTASAVLVLLLTRFVRVG